SQGPHSALPRQERRPRRIRQAWVVARRHRHHGLDRAVSRAQRRRLSRRGLAGNTLAWRRYAGGLQPRQLGRDEEVPDRRRGFIDVPSGTVGFSGEVSGLRWSAVSLILRSTSGLSLYTFIA